VRYVQDEPYPAWQPLKKPDMGYRCRKLNVSNALSPDFLSCNFYTTAIADNSLVFYAFIFATRALPVFLRTKYGFAEQTIRFGSEGSVVDSFRLLHLTAGTIFAFARGTMTSSFLRPCSDLF
jgi:hypothetical protein